MRLWEVVMAAIAHNARESGPRRIGDVLAELFVEYESRFPESCAVVEATKHQGGSQMLVLARKPGERIVINETITVTVLEVRRGQIRLGIEAPPEVSVRREEVRQPAAAA
jgi:carbon storage regulator